MSLRRFLLAFLVVIAPHAMAVQRLALLVGINDYTASHLGALPHAQPVPGRDWPNLNGAVRDARLLRDMLLLLYAFDRPDTVVLLDQNATRAAILQGVEQLAAHAGKDDVVLFFFAGHGSQVRNTLSDEVDQLDESIVPADSRAGARDIRDKELRSLFNRILDRGAKLTVVLDNCHSGSGARALTTDAVPRGVKADLRDVAQAPFGPRPEDRGALVLSASTDSGTAWETRDESHAIHGAFSWALVRAMRDAAPGEPAIDTFSRAAARLRGETPYQDPVIGGNTSARFTPLLGSRTDRGGRATMIAVEKVRPDGTILLQGGWANGLTIGSKLRSAGNPRAQAFVTITALRGIGESEARASANHLPKPGALLDIASWAAPPVRNLRVFIPQVSAPESSIARLGSLLSRQASRRRIRWISDPTVTTPAALLRWNAHAWELLRPDGPTQRFGKGDAGAIAAIRSIRRGSTLFVQFPAPAAIASEIAIGPGTEREAIEPVSRPEEADYILAACYSRAMLTYAWIRPAMRRADRPNSPLPLRTAWLGTAIELRDTVMRLRRMQAWQLLDTPPGAGSSYRLALRRDRDGQLVHGNALAGGERYRLVLLPSGSSLRRMSPRSVYVFVMDSDGKSVLLFPRDGSVENRFPLADAPNTEEIDLGPSAVFDASPPYGIDTYFLLTTDEPLRNPWILEWDGVRGPVPPSTSLEELLSATGSATRSVTVVTPTSWSIERVVWESIPPRHALPAGNGS